MGRIKTSSHSMCERLLVWVEEARRAGRESRGAALLLLAWRAFEQPPGDHKWGD